MKPIDIFLKVQKAKRPGEHYTKTLKRLGFTQKQYFAGRAAKAGMASKGVTRKKWTRKEKATAPAEVKKGGKVMVILASLDEVRELLS